MLERFDSWLLDKFEKFTQWWQRMFGQNCFWWARNSLTSGCILLFSGLSLGSMSIKNGSGNADIPLIGIIIILVLIGHMKQINKLESEVIANQTKGIANKEKLMVGLRLFFASVVLVLIFTLLLPDPRNFNHYLIALGFFNHLTVVHYFIACDPLPPGKSKVRQFLESIAGKIKETFAPLPQPVPVRIPSR